MSTFPWHVAGQVIGIRSMASACGTGCVGMSFSLAAVGRSVAVGSYVKVSGNK